MLTAEEKDELRGWFAGRLPDGLYDPPLEITVDREEITVVGRISEPSLAEDVSEAEREAALEARIEEFRDRTRGERMAVARRAERRYRRKVAWGVECGGRRTVFTNVAAPVMTRLRQPQREVLDTLIAGGVARSRSEALAWCVRLVQQHADSWLTELQDSLEQVQRVRDHGPDRRPPSPSDGEPRDAAPDEREDS
ncbi:hypothetical protein AB0M28_32265 [Streptomyces sp. NPDC051940]|uniref:hypothetical protein n=1 Tax=Streptomyces sp. NPDC051940 TaxID=3155675 RepID=UPI0034223D1D